MRDLLIDECRAMLAQHSAYVREHFEDMPEIRDWTWTVAVSDRGRRDGAVPEQRLVVAQGGAASADPARAPGAETRAAEAAVEGIGTGQARAWVRGPDEARAAGPSGTSRPIIATAVEVALDLMAGVLVGPPALVAHRVVHGGSRHVAPCARRRGSPCQLDALDSVRAAAPAGGARRDRAALRRWPGVPQVACFDTAFHATLPEIARRLPLPEACSATRSAATDFRAVVRARDVVLGAEAPRAHRHRAPRERREPGGGQRRSLHRHDDGLHADRRRS